MLHDAPNLDSDLAVSPKLRVSPTPPEDITTYLLISGGYIPRRLGDTVRLCLGTIAERDFSLPTISRSMRVKL